ncbi:MAG: iron-containing alcohol dehydrogenase [Bacteroidaceae bacterium]
MNNFTFYSPTEFIFGPNTEQQAGPVLLRYGACRVLLVSGSNSAQRSGLLDRIKKSLSDSSIFSIDLTGIQPNPTDEKVYEGIALVQRENIDFLLAVGGGSVIDTAKAIAIGAPYAGDFWDFYSGVAKSEKALSVGVVLTIPAAGSEGSGNSVITKKATQQKLSLRTTYALRPKFSILNPELTMTLSPYQTAAGIVDMMVHVMERYFSNTEGNEITDRICEGILKGILKEAPKVMKNPRDYDARANILWASTVAHNGICGVGRVEDWASHFMEHELSALYDVTHGAGLAVIVPAWMEYIVQQVEKEMQSKVITEDASSSNNACSFAVYNLSPLKKLSQFAVRVMGVAPSVERQRTAREGIIHLRRFFHSLNMPLTFKELDLEVVDIPLMVKNLHLNKGKTIGAFYPLTAKDTELIYKLASLEKEVDLLSNSHIN